MTEPRVSQRRPAVTWAVTHSTASSESERSGYPSTRQPAAEDGVVVVDWQLVQGFPNSISR